MLTVRTAAIPHQASPGENGSCSFSLEALQLLFSQVLAEKDAIIMRRLSSTQSLDFQWESECALKQLRVTIHSALYLHHVLDVWFEEVVKPRLKGEAYEIRFADDAILCFQHREDAEKVLRVLPKRFEKYGLTLHPEKTRLIEFGRHAARNARKQGKKPETFDFLGFKHLCARSRKGKFTVHVKTLAKRLRRGLKAIADWCKQHRHEPVNEQQKTLNAKLRGHYQY